MQGLPDLVVHLVDRVRSERFRLGQPVVAGENILEPTYRVLALADCRENRRRTVVARTRSG